MLYLFVATFFWGSTFLVQRSASDIIDPFLYNGIRFTLAGLILYSSCLLFKLRLSFILLKHASICGALVMVAINLQQLGISFTTAGKAGVITSLYLLFIPLILLFEGRVIKLREAMLLLLSLSGFVLLSEINSLTFNLGDSIVLVSAIVFSFHVIAIDKYSSEYNPFLFSSIQFLVCGILSLIVSSFSAKDVVTSVQMTFFEIIYGCIISVLFGYTLQVIGQKRTPAHTAGFIMSLEGPIALILGSLILSESHSKLQIVGAVLITLSAVIISLEAPKKSGI